jgi:murein L,D-transpeptidase YcbB/YkuD
MIRPCRRVLPTVVMILAGSCSALAFSEPSTILPPQPGAEATIRPEAETPAVQKLRDLLTSDIARYITRKEDRAGVEAFYNGRGFAPLWTSDGVPTARAKEVIAFLRGVGAEGLEPTDYPTPAFANPETLAEDELKLTNSIITFARHSSTGRVNFTRVSGAIQYNLQAPDPADVLGKIAESGNIKETLDAYNPQQPGYKALKAKLAAERSRNGSDDKADRVPDGPALSVGMEDARVPLLRKRLKLGDADSRRYDQSVAKAVKAFQKKAGMKPTGVADGSVIARLNADPQPRTNTVATILANMERWRWLPRDLGKAHVVVNIPDYSLKVADSGKTVWSTRIVVGKVGEQATPLLSETMKFITVNPTWNVPPSIVRNEYLPALQRNPDALERMGLKVTYRRNGSIHVYQPPGARNALGRIRFNFPNKFLVYQHDTPSKHLFAQNERAYSHGCMRVQYPEKYAEVLLSITQPKDGFTAERIQRMYGDTERTINLKEQIPVHITYQTAFVDDSGQLQTRPDIYGHDRELLNVLRNQRQVADLPIERGSASSNKPAMARTAGTPRASRASGGREERATRRYRSEPGYALNRPFNQGFDWFTAR